MPIEFVVFHPVLAVVRYGAKLGIGRSGRARQQKD